MNECKEDGCVAKVSSHGLCATHSMRARRLGLLKVRTADPVARFWEKVDKDGPIPAHRPDLGPCWVWTAHKIHSGYGAVRWDGRMQGAHRVSWQLHRGPIPTGMEVLHHCDHRPCINPAHFFLGTNADNVADKIAKGRQIKGEQLTAAKLTEGQVLEMRALRAAGKSVEELGAAFGVAPAHASRICLGRTWKHLGATLAPKRPGKLTDQQVVDLRARRAAGASRFVLASEFGVSPAHVSRVCLGRYW